MARSHVRLTVCADVLTSSVCSRLSHQILRFLDPLTHFNRRREADPLGEGHACTWRMRLIKVAARIEVEARCVRVLLSGSWPFLDHFRDVGEALLSGS